MAAKGTESKSKLTEQLLNTFEGAFIASDGKTIRVPFQENGERVEIKITLTAAKDCEGGDNLAPVSAFGENTAASLAVPEPTEEEKAKVAKLMEALNF